ncbi:MAG: NAD/NADP octopine/nopaline dehydrogenase family protein [Actinobacteria bacterium]|nr:NAD/NADP octopine/nopaline dehydrogenase family protein [Actinomycetota bacterium]
MRVAVLGSGNGGLAMAFEWAQAGHEVALFDFEEFGDTIAAVAAAGGITAEGDLSGFVELDYAGHDAERALRGADVVFAVGPAYSNAPFGRVCRDHVVAGQIYVVCPGSCAGALVFKQSLGVALDDDSVTVAETSTLPYAVRITGPAEITVYNRLKGGYFVAAVPASATPRVHALMAEVFPEISAASSVWQTTLQNANPVIHPAVTLCNAALIERTGGDFLFYEEGVTEAVGRLIKAVDDERIALGAALGVTVIPDPEIGISQGYQTQADYGIGYSEAPGFKGIKAQPRLDYRYFNEDAGFGLVFLTDLGRQLGIPTPAMDAVLTVSSILMGRDYRAEAARTMAGLGLAGLSLDRLRNLL